jgi:hypothetical protein
MNWKLANRKGSENTESAPEKGEEQGTYPMWTINKQMARKPGRPRGGSDKPLPEVRQVVDYKAHLLSRWETPKVKGFCKIEKQTVNHHNTLTAGVNWWITDLAPEKGGEPKSQATSKQVQQIATSKTGQLVDYRADLLNLRTACKLKLPHITEWGADQAAAAERQKKKKQTLPTSQPSGKTTTELLLKHQHQDWMLEE